MIVRGRSFCFINEVLFVATPEAVPRKDARNYDASALDLKSLGGILAYPSVQQILSGILVLLFLLRKRQRSPAMETAAGV